MLREQDRRRQQIRQDGVAVRYVHHVLVLCDFGHEIPWVEVVRDWHAQSQDQAVVVVLDYLQETQSA
jgi:hypothetical protein